MFRCPQCNNFFFLKPPGTSLTVCWVPLTAIGTGGFHIAWIVTPKRLTQTQIPEVKMGDATLEHVENYEYLGVWFDSTLNWKFHLEKTKNKIKQRLGILRRTRHLIDKDTCFLLYNSIVLPLFDYCDIVYTNSNMTEIVKLQRLQSRAAKIILQVPFDTRTHEILRTLKWFYFTERNYYHRCVLMYKCVTGSCPSYLAGNFKINNNVYSTRSSRRRDTDTPLCKTVTGQRAFFFPRCKKLEPSLPCY